MVDRRSYRSDGERQRQRQGDRNAGSAYDPDRESSRRSNDRTGESSRRSDDRTPRVYYERGRDGEPPNLYYRSARGTEVSSRNTSTRGRESAVQNRDGSVTLRAGGTDGTRTDVRIGQHSLRVSDGRGGEVSYSHSDFGGRITYNERSGRVSVGEGDQRRSYTPREFVNMVREEAAAALVAEGVRAGVGYVARSIREHFGR